MQYNKHTIKAAVILAAGSVLFSMSFVNKGYASSVSPGTATDPLVSQSYVDARFNQLQTQINNLTVNGTGTIGTTTATTTTGNTVTIDTVTNVSTAVKDQIIEEVMAQLDFLYGKALASGNTVVSENEVTGENTSIYQPVFASNGQYIIGGEGAEIILRSGGAVGYLGGALNGIVNATTGEEVMDGMVIPYNNILIIPRADGRGVRLTVDSWFLIKGAYQIQ